MVFNGNLKVKHYGSGTYECPILARRPRLFK